MTTSAPTLEAYCIPGHTRGSKPYIVPLAGNNDRETPLYLAYHGREYVAADGTVSRHPVRMTMDDTRAAIELHELACQVAAGTVCGMHDRPAPCLECA